MHGGVRNAAVFEIGPTPPLGPRTVRRPKVCWPPPEVNIKPPLLVTVPLISVVDIVRPPAETISRPPELTSVPMSIPPEKTVSTPPLLIVVLSDVPPPKTSAVSPELRMNGMPRPKGC